MARDWDDGALHWERNVITTNRTQNFNVKRATHQSAPFTILLRYRKDYFNLIILIGLSFKYTINENTSVLYDIYKN